MRRLFTLALSALALALSALALAVALPVAPAQAQAVTKTIDLGIGVNGTYWRIGQVNVDIEAGKMLFVLRGYVDKATYQAGKGYLSERRFVMDIPGGAATMTWAQLISAMRDYLKLAVEFSGAVDAS